MNIHEQVEQVYGEMHLDYTDCKHIIMDLYKELQRQKVIINNYEASRQDVANDIMKALSNHNGKTDLLNSLTEGGIDEAELQADS